MTIRNTVETFNVTQLATQAITLPTYQAGDVVTIAVANNPDGTAAIGTITAGPTGFTEIATNQATGAASDGRLSQWYKVMDGTEGSSVNMTTSTAMSIGAIATSHFDIDTNNVLDVAAPAISNPASSTSPAITTVTDGATVLRTILVDGAPGFSDSSIPAGHTLLGTIVQNPPSNGMNLGFAYEIQATAGNAGTGVWSGTGSEENVAGTFALRPLTAGITSVDSDYGVGSDEFDYNDSSLDINGMEFGATQGTGAVYISDANTLAGSVNEVDVSSAITAWSDIQITLNLTLLSGAEQASLDTLGPGSRYIIVTDNGAANEYGSPVQTAHRAKAFVLSASPNIAVSGENTTAQLAAPTAKTTANFGGGRIQDDENPGDAVDIGSDQYREDEWAIEATVDSVDTETYQFRVLIDGNTIDTYTVTPSTTISAAAGEISNLPGTSLTLTPNAPQAVATENNTATLPSASLTLTPSAPQAVTTENNISAIATTAAIALTAFAPQLAATENHISTLPSAAMSLAAQAPQAVTTEANVVNLPGATLTLAPNAPQAITTENNFSTLPAATLTLTPYAPTVDDGALATTPTRIGNETVDAEVDNSNANITVPANCDLIVISWSYYDFEQTTSGLADLSLGSGTPASFTIAQNLAGGTNDMGVGIAYLHNPATGVQQLNWDWSGPGTGALAEGGRFYVTYVQDVNAASPVQDTAASRATGDTKPAALVLNSTVNNLVIGHAQSISTDPPNAGIAGQTVYLNNDTYRQEATDLAQVDSPGATTTTFDMQSGASVVEWSTMAAISISPPSADEISQLPAAALTLTPNAPQAVTTENNFATLPSASISTSAYAPQAVTTENNFATLPSASISTTAYAPTIVTTEINRVEIDESNRQDNGTSFVAAEVDPDQLLFYLGAAAHNANHTETAFNYGGTDFVDVAGYSSPFEAGAPAELHVHGGYILDANIPGGTNALNYTHTPTPTVPGFGVAFKLFNVDQVTPVRPASEHTLVETNWSGAGNPGTLDLNVEVGDLVVVLYYGEEGAWSFGGDWAGTWVLNEVQPSGAGTGETFIGYQQITADDPNFQITATHSAGGSAQAFVIKPTPIDEISLLPSAAVSLTPYAPQAVTTENHISALPSASLAITPNAPTVDSTEVSRVTHNDGGTNLDDGQLDTPPALVDGLAFHVHVAQDPAARTISTNTLGAQAFSQVIGYAYPHVDSEGNIQHVGHGYILDTDIPAGSSLLTITYSEAMDVEPEGFMFYFENVDQTAPVRPATEHTLAEDVYLSAETGLVSTIDLNVEDGDYVVIVINTGPNHVLTLGGDWGGQVEREWNPPQGQGHIYSDAIRTDDTNYQVTINRTGGAGGGIIQAFVIKPPRADNYVTLPSASLTVAPQIPQAVTTEGADADVSQLPAATLALTPYAPQAVTQNVAQLPSASITLTANVPQAVTTEGADADVSQLPSAGLTLTPRVPQAVTSENNISDLASASLLTVSFAPSAVTSEDNRSDLPSAGLNVTAYAPSAVTSEANIAQLPGASLAVTPQTPQAFTSEGEVSTLPSASLTLAPNAPTIETSEANYSNLPGTSLSLNAQVPQAVTSEANFSTLPSASITLTPNVPQAISTAGETVFLPAVTIDLATYVPTFETTERNVIVLPSAAITLTANAPTFEFFDPNTSQMVTATLAITPQAPNAVTSERNVIQLPSVGLVIAPQAPVAETTEGNIIQVATANLVITAQAPTVFVPGNELASYDDPDFIRIDDAAFREFILIR